MYTNKMTYDMQVTYMKEVVEMYKKNADNAVEGLKLMEKRFIELEKQFEQYKKDKLVEVFESKRMFDAQIKAVNEKYEFLKWILKRN